MKSTTALSFLNDNSRLTFRELRKFNLLNNTNQYLYRSFVCIEYTTLVAKEKFLTTINLRWFTRNLSNLSVN